MASTIPRPVVYILKQRIGERPLFCDFGPKMARSGEKKNSGHCDRTQKRDETPSSRNETPSSSHRRTTRLLLIAATTRLRPPDVRSANESSVAQACNESSVAQADGASTSAVRPVIRNAVQSLVPLSPHRPSPGNCLREHRESRRLPHHASQRPAITPVEVDLRASAVLSSSECLFSGGDDALATHSLALTHHAWPNHDFGATTSSHDQILNQTLNDQSSTTAQPQQLRRSPNSAAARTQRDPELQQ